MTMASVKEKWNEATREGMGDPIGFVSFHPKAGEDKEREAKGGLHIVS